MAKRIAAVKARQNLGTLLDDVKLTGAEYLIERAGKPTAAIISLEAYRRYRCQRQEAFSRIDEFRQRLAERVPTEELEGLIDAAARDVRD